MHFQTITFFVASAEVAEEAKSLDPDSDWIYFGTGVQCWIVQTYLRLRAAGYEVNLTSTPPQNGIVIIHPDDLGTYFRHPKTTQHCFIVCTRADRPPQQYADFEVVQNMYSASSPNTHHIPHWPQPGLIPRKSDRSTTIENIAFKGSSAECNVFFENEQWRNFLRSAKLNWVTDKAYWQGSSHRPYAETNWNDYSQTDIIVALRCNPESCYPNKPASKLVNAWTAGVPAILGAEIAYREIRRSELDFIEIDNPEAVMSAVQSLLNAPARYLAMVNNGHRRAEEYSPSRILEHWIRLLFYDLQDITRRPRWTLLRNTPIGLRRRLRQLQRLF